MPAIARVYRSIAASLIAAAFALAAGCGLPQFILLEPPISISIDELVASVTFLSNPENDPDSFLGYELYYKFYAPATLDAQFAADLSAISGAVAGSMPGVVTQRGFRRVIGAGQGGGPPLIPIAPTDRGTSFPVRILIDNSVAELSDGIATWDPPSGPPLTVTLQRNLIAPKPFRPDAYVTSGPDRDADIPAGDYVGELALALVIVSYGVDFTTFQPLYSQPVMTDRRLRLVIE